jgi:hypothetical protein
MFRNMNSLSRDCGSLKVCYNQVFRNWVKPQQATKEPMHNPFPVIVMETHYVTIHYNLKQGWKHYVTLQHRPTLFQISIFNHL